MTEVKHFSALPYDEIGALMKELAERDGLAPIALRFLILTAARTGEVIGATWPEIDLIKRVWSVPAARMKAKREHRALLSTAALDILRGLPRHSEQIFPLGDHMLLRELAGRRTSVHGLRASFRTWATERTNFADKIVEAALAHRIGDNKVQAAYERGDLLERRKKLMQAWCDFCTKPAPASTAIVPMRRA